MAAKRGAPKTGDARVRDLAIHTSKLMKRYSYAAMADISATWEGPEEYPKNKFEHYDNYIKDKKEQTSDLKSRIGYTTDASKCLVLIFDNFVYELSQINLEGKDVSAISQELYESNDHASYGAHVITMAAKYKYMLRKTSQAAMDPKAIFQAQLQQNLPSIRGHPVLCAQLAVEYDNYLKIVATNFAHQSWYQHQTVNEFALFGFLSPNCDQSLIDRIRPLPEEKKPRVRKPKPAATAATAAPNAPAAPTATTSPDAPTASAAPPATPPAATTVTPAVTEAAKPVLTDADVGSILDGI